VVSTSDRLQGFLQVLCHRFQVQFELLTTNYHVTMKESFTVLCLYFVCSVTNGLREPILRRGPRGYFRNESCWFAGLWHHRVWSFSFH